MAGSTFSHTFAEAGTFDYFCMVHPWMSGSVMVSTEDMEHSEEMGHNEMEEMGGMEHSDEHAASGVEAVSYTHLTLPTNREV